MATDRVLNSVDDPCGLYAFGNDFCPQSTNTAGGGRASPFGATVSWRGHSLRNPTSASTVRTENSEQKTHAGGSASVNAETPNHCGPSG
jgi:hypothetical protein